MALFLLILGGLIAINFILLKFSMQSVDNNKKKPKKYITDQKLAASTETTDIPKAA